ncbi:MAG: DUF2461 domain-containing protein [Chitinophagaceae bacterium]|jgi:uncharacterized protein (TIGR02453 family)|nr:DUF2461 domain-containing protein [Chitinophagaceae bacterium]
MLQKATLQFLASLKKNNSKPWFDANRQKYEAAKADFLQLTQTVLEGVASFDNSVQHLQPKDCVFRINRDVRFSKNKAPYKTNMAMYLSKGGKKALDCAGYYLHIEPGAAFMAGGIWMPMAPELKKIRQEIDYSFADLQQLLKAKSFKQVYGDLERSEQVMLTRPPKGYEADNEAIEYLKLKSFIAQAPLPDALLSSQQLATQIVKQFATLYPLIQFLNRALDHEE